MIKLEVENYCHNCPGFKPVVVKTARGGSRCDTLIRCKYGDRCFNIKEYLIHDDEMKKTLVKELKEVNNLGLDC